jgi:hypothetical protein
MKNSILMIFLIAFTILITGCISNEKRKSPLSENQIEIVVNPTIDLFGVIHYLVGDKQYTENLLPKYNKEVENYFGHLRNDSSIKFAKECKNRFHINGDAPMDLAVYIGPPPALTPQLDLSNLLANLDPRWDSVLIISYLENARLFACESNFMEFHNSQKEFQNLAMSNLKDMISNEQICQWYYEFFGNNSENFKMYLALNNGSCNYGYPVKSKTGEVEFVSLIGARFPDIKGIPTYPKDWFLPVIIHEYIHSYINPLIKSKPDEFKKLGEALLVTHRAKMVESGYDVWNVIIQEYIVRACTILFMEQNDSRRKAKINMKRDISVGFTEIEGLVMFFDKYENNRDKYDNIQAFLPEIKKYFESYLEELK